MTNSLKAEFWNRIGHVQAGMLETAGNTPVPMAPYGDAEANAIWFITARDTSVARAAATGAEARLQVADPKANLYATVEVRVMEVNAPEKLEELWSVVASAWFEEGRRDDDVRLVRLQPASAEVWATASGAGFLYEIAKARFTGDTPDAGDHGVVTF